MAEALAQTALMLPGGGARGAYQVGALAAARELVPRRENPFPIIVGTSAGAVNAAVLASHAGDLTHGIDRLTHFWSSMRCRRIYRTDWPCVLGTGLHWVATLLLGRLGLRPPHSLLDTTPLRELLEQESDLERIADWIDTGDLRALAITASAYVSSGAMSFFHAPPEIPEWRRGRRRGRRTPIGVDHVLASAALPILFPPVRVGNEHFGDGGLRQTAPLSPAIHLGADRILIISTRDERQDPEPGRAAEMPTVGDVAGYMLDIVFMDNLQADLDRLQRINHTLSLMTPEQVGETSLRPIDTLVLKPSEDIRAIADRHAHRMPASVKLLLASIGAWRPGTRLPSYLLFEAEYCRELMDLGYRDTMDRGDELRRLLDD